jgi:hypothetical protein
MVREEQTGSVTSRQLGQFGIGAYNEGSLARRGVSIYIPTIIFDDSQKHALQLVRKLITR